MTQTETNNKPSRILAFDASYILVAAFRSIREAANMTGAVRQSLIKAAYGDIISVKDKYWRILPEDFVLDPDDIGQLTLFEFDESVGEDRKIYATRQMLKGSIMLESEYQILKATMNK